ncbi:helix-turn-helix domain-containing protein [Steroidobacter flavus]|uniref:Helix-turn-helix domain-containing protein n=1 Tax=Steroidobacter flavus TaxID=1842136 RepID=A0ABV8SS15_9GAMM
MTSLRTPNYRQLLDRLTTARQRASLTQPQLAERLSASPEFVASYEKGKDPSRRSEGATRGAN